MSVFCPLDSTLYVPIGMESSSLSPRLSSTSDSERGLVQYLFNPRLSQLKQHHPLLNASWLHVVHGVNSGTCSVARHDILHYPSLPVHFWRLAPRFPPCPKCSNPSGQFMIPKPPCTCFCVLNHSVMSDSAMPWTVACQAPLCMEFSRQEYWGRLPFPTPGNLPEPGNEPTSPALAGRFFTTCFWSSLNSRCPSSRRTYRPFSPLEELLLILQYPSRVALP